jgi:hypothetical protein
MKREGRSQCFGNDAFGGPAVPSEPQHDIVEALIDWVKFGNPPDRITATKYLNDNPGDGVAFTRPLCVFPKIARYKGTGNTADAARACQRDDRSRRCGASRPRRSRSRRAR